MELYKITSALNITMKDFFAFDEGDVLKIEKKEIIQIPGLIVGNFYTKQEL